jgi:hypothetical protein
MPYTPVFSQGVKFIKIARVDKQGKDNTLSLQELNSIRIDYSDTNIVEYPITSISKYDDYFLFGVAATNITSSTDNYILDYKFKAGWTGSLTDAVTILSAYNLSGSVNYDNLDYFNTSSGEYVLGNQPNIPITIVSSASVFTTGSQLGQLLIFSNLYGTVAQSTFFNPNNTTVIVSASYTTVPTSGESFYLAMTTTGPINATASFFVTQSINPTVSSSDLVVLQPYIDEDFFVSDYNVLAGNAVIPRYSELYMDVDYTTNVIQAVNSASIIDGTATRAAVQDSNYTTFAHISPRYIGKELESAKINEWTEGDISYGKVPNVSNPEVNFVSFKSLNGTSPQWGNNNVDLTQVNIEYIIDNNNNLTKPINDTDNINLNTVRQTFPEVIATPVGKEEIEYITSNATIFLNNVEVSGYDLSTLNGQWPLYKSGYRIEPILYTQTASYDAKGNITGFGYFNTMSFVQGQQGSDDNKNDYMMYAPGLNNQEFQESTPEPYVIQFTAPTFTGSFANFNTISSIYKPTGSLGDLKTEGYILDFHVKIEGRLSPRNFQIATVYYALQKSIDGGSNWFNLVRAGRRYEESKVETNTLFYQELNATTSSLYRVVAEIYDIKTKPYIISTATPKIILFNTSYFWVTQYPNPGTGTCTAPFWTTGSSANILLASTASDGLNNYRNQKQKDIENSGFKPINLDFEPQVYDEIRFQGIENLTFAIIAVTSSNNNQMILNLDQEIPNGVNLDYFLLRRYVDDPSSILLNVNYPIPDNSGSSNSTGNGILKPQYVTSEVNTIIQNTLTQSLI